MIMVLKSTRCHQNGRIIVILKILQSNHRIIKVLGDKAVNLRQTVRAVALNMGYQYTQHINQETCNTE